MARSWGDGSPTQPLHHIGYDLYAQLSSPDELNLQSYRTVPVLSVSPGTNNLGQKRAREDGKIGQYMPNWLDGNIGRVGLMGRGDDTAQVTPSEVVEKMIASDVCDGVVEVVLGECVGIDTDNADANDASIETEQVKGVRYVPRGETEEQLLEADVVVVSAGPWSCKAEDWFGNVISLPMEGVKSTSIVWKRPSSSLTDGDENENEGDEFVVDGTALFCGEDDRFGTHLEVYPRPDGSIYICGIGGSDYIPSDELKRGAYREECNAKESRVDAASNAFRTMSNTYNAKGTLEKVQACMRPCPPDAMPYMGKIPGYEGAYVNAGHNCWGIAWAPSCGLAMTELILEGESRSVDLRYFDPSRFTTKVGGGRGRKRRGQSVGEQW